MTDESNTAIVKADPVATPAPAAPSILNIIHAVSTDPNVSVDKVSQLMDLLTRQEADQARKSWFRAYTSAVAELSPVLKDEDNKQTSSKYASYGALDAIVRPAFAAHGLAYTYTTETSPLENHIRIVAFLLHEDGHRERYEIEQPCDGLGPKGNPIMSRTHAVAAATTYGKRILLGMMSGAPVEEDAVITQDQMHGLAQLLERSGSDVSKFLAIAGVQSLDRVRARDLPGLQRMLTAKIRAKQEVVQ